MIYHVYMFVPFLGEVKAPLLDGILVGLFMALGSWALYVYRVCFAMFSRSWWVVIIQLCDFVVSLQMWNSIL